jgi:hypothetical protein
MYTWCSYRHCTCHNLHVHVMFIPSLCTSQSSCTRDVYIVIKHVTIFMHTWCLYCHHTRHNFHVHVMFISSLYMSQFSCTRDVYIVIIHVMITIYIQYLQRKLKHLLLLSESQKLLHVFCHETFLTWNVMVNDIIPCNAKLRY